MGKKRIQVYVDDEAKRRIELAAMIREVPVTEYCREAIEQQLAEDDMLDREHVALRVRRPDPGALHADLAALRQRILARRGGRPIDEDILDAARREREDELLDLR